MSHLDFQFLPRLNVYLGFFYFMLSKPYIICRQHSVGACVVKLKYDNHYVIIKCKQLYQSLKTVENALNAIVRGGVNNKQSLYYFLFDHVLKNPNKKFTYEVLLESESGYELLVKEHEELEIGIAKDKGKCLNVNTTPYIPEWNPENRAYNWITKGDVLNYKNWLNNRKKHK